MVHGAGRGCVYAVAGGIGGTGTGALRGLECVDSLAHFFTTTAARFSGSMLKDTIARADQTLNQVGADEPKIKRSRTTLALLSVQPDDRRGHMTSIGDSGNFRLHRGRW